MIRSIRVVCLVRLVLTVLVLELHLALNAQRGNMEQLHLVFLKRRAAYHVQQEDMQVTRVHHHVLTALQAQVVRQKN